MDDRDGRDNEESLILSFISPNYRRRMLTLLRTSGGRRKFRAQLAHFRGLDSRFAQLVPSNQQSANEIERLLKEKGAPKACYVVSEDPQLDGREMLLSDALDRIVGSGTGSLVLCIPGHLGYYEGELPKERYLLIRS